MLKGKNILLGVSGGIAAYKSAALASLLIKAGASVDVIMTPNALNFITPHTFEAITKRRVSVDTFDRAYAFEVEHISLAKRADLVLIAPATANVLAKLANGLADDMLTTTVLACSCPKLVAPAMNTAMYQNPATQRNLRLLKELGFEVVEPALGRLACGDIGAGKLPEPPVLAQYLERAACKKNMAGLRVLVTAGPTREALDPVRFITNHSTGRMGYAIAWAAALRGAEVTLVSGPTELAPPPFVETVPVTSAREMFEAVTSRSSQQDIIVKAAAVADYRPARVKEDKIKKFDGAALIALERTDDILQYLGEHRREGQFLCGFSMETRDMVENSRSKLLRKHLDMIVANNLKVAGAGFGVDTNVVTLITGKELLELPLLSKDEVAARLLDEILARR